MKVSLVVHHNALNSSESYNILQASSLDEDDEMDTVAVVRVEGCRKQVDLCKDKTFITEHLSNKKLLNYEPVESVKCSWHEGKFSEGTLWQSADQWRSLL